MGHRFTSTALAALMLGVATPVIAQSTEAVRTFSIGAGPLERSLPVFAQQSGLQILYPSALVTGRQARALTGEYTPEAALAELLRGTGLAYRQSRPTVFVLVDPSARAEAEPQATQLEEIVVTGTYLRGADSPSPVTVITQDDIARQGRATVAETLGSFNLKADGVLFALPGGDLRMAVGVDYRQERFETSGENFISGAALRIAAPTAFERDVSAAFVELRAPLVGPDNARPGLERLELSLAGRVEDHERPCAWSLSPSRACSRRRARRWPGKSRSRWMSFWGSRASDGSRSIRPARSPSSRSGAPEAISPAMIWRPKAPTGTPGCTASTSTPPTIRDRS